MDSEDIELKDTSPEKGENSPGLGILRGGVDFVSMVGTVATVDDRPSRKSELNSRPEEI